MIVSDGTHSTTERMTIVVEGDNGADISLIIALLVLLFTGLSIVLILITRKRSYSAEE